jgi:hypothetical protein
MSFLSDQLSLGTENDAVLLKTENLKTVVSEMPV